MSISLQSVSADALHILVLPLEYLVSKASLQHSLKLRHQTRHAYNVALPPER
jgi:hypothetical protein